MTIDKIKHHMQPDIFNYWTTLKNGNLPHDEKINYLKRAKKTLEDEISAGILTGIMHAAELNYINLLLK